MEPSDEHFFQLVEELEDQVFDEGDSRVYDRIYQERKDDGRYDKYEEWSKEWREGMKELQRDLKRGSEKNEREANRIFSYMMGLLHEATPERRSQASPVDDLIERSFSDLLGDYTSREPWNKESEDRSQRYNQETFYDFVDRDLSLKELKERNDFYNFVDQELDLSKFKDMLDDE